LANQNFKVKNGLEVGPNSSGIGTIITTNSSGNVGVGTTNPQYKLHVLGSLFASNIISSPGFTGDINAGVGTITTLSGTTLTYTTGNITNLNASTGNFSGIVTASRFVSTVSTGTAPLSVTSTTKVSNLNADLFDDQNGSYYLDYNNFTNTPTIGNGTLTLAVSGTGLSGSASFTANQSGNSAFTVTSNATSANTGSTIVARDGAGGFNAGIITATYFRSGSDSSSTPGHSWSGDANTGMFNPTGNQIAWSTAGTERARLTATGLGIGIDVPGARLQLQGSGNTGLRITDFDYYGPIGALTDYGWYIGQRASGGDLEIYLDTSSSSPALRITPSNEVLINRSTTTGTSSQNLQVTGGAYFSGAVAIGLVSPTASRLHVSVGSQAVGEPAAIIQSSDSTVSSNNILLDLKYSGDTSGSGGYFVRVQDSDTVIGGIQLNSATTVAYTGTSDYRLKTNVQPLTGAVDRVLSLKPCTFDWINGNSSEGFIAHELQEVVPLAVTGTKDQVDEDGNMIPQGVDPRHIVPVLTSALQEALKRIEELEIKVAEIESLM